MRPSFTQALGLLLACLLAGFPLAAQSVLFSEDFNDCELPADWEVSLDGNPDASWHIGLPDNPNMDGSTIDGSCMLIFDDDATGNQTPPWTLQLKTPSFDGTGYSELMLSMDIHFRQFGESSLEVLVWDGSAYQSVVVYKGADDQTGEQLSDYATFTTDLSFYANDDMHLVIQYDDGGIWAWYAGVDNIEVIGQGDATNIILENFNDCQLPAGWTSQIVTGEFDWQFGLVDNPNAGSNNSINGTCFAFFDDDVHGNGAISSKARLISPPFDGTQFANFYVDFDIILRRYEDLENLEILVYDGQEMKGVTAYFTDLGGPMFSQFVHETVDLSAFRAPQMQIVFQYEDGGGWGWWAGIDNVKISGTGLMNDRCDNAINLELDAPCLMGDNTNALFLGDAPACEANHVAGLWYQYEAGFTGILEITTGARFNDLITVYEGDCGSLAELTCHDADEHGFTGETLRMDVHSGTKYYFRISGKDKTFGVPKGSLCVGIQEVDAYPSSPVNDGCTNAQELMADDDCLQGATYFAGTDLPLTTLNELARSDVWYQFSPVQTGAYKIETQADFADELTLYSGDCDNLTEIMGELDGQLMTTPELQEGTVYFLRVSGTFAIIEGNLCVTVTPVSETPPANDDCVQAIAVTLNGDCAEGSNVDASLSGPAPSCEPYPAASIWYQFVAPITGTVWMQSGADFIHTVALFSGTCNNLEEIHCEHNPTFCSGYFAVGSLNPGETYYVQIASANQYYGFDNEGTVCLSILEGQGDPPAATQLSASVQCLTDGLGVLNVTLTGDGTPALAGNTNGEYLQTGDFYIIVAQDDNGCEWSASGTVDCGGDICEFSTSTSLTDASCFGASDGSGVISASGEGGPFSYQWSNGSTEEMVENLSAGQYFVTVTNQEGCQKVDVVDIAQPEELIIHIDSIAGSAPGMEAGAIYAQLSGGFPPYTYYLNGSPVASWDQLAPGDYQLSIVDGNGCSSGVWDVTVPALTGVEELPEGVVLDVYPNPTVEWVNLELSTELTGPVQLEVIDVSGRVLHAASWNAQADLRYSLNLKSYAAGVYQVQLKGAYWQYRVKVVKL
jgi:hypothetical protein